MMNAVTIEVSLTGLESTAAGLQAFRTALSNRKPLHMEMAKTAAAMTTDFLGEDARHATAARLGAAATGYRAKVSKLVEPAADDAQAMVNIPRRTGYGRAFGTVTLRPGSGRKYLTIPAHAETYGKVAGDSSHGPLKFAFLGRFRALVFAESSGRHRKGEVAYWLKSEVVQKQDRTLLPSDSAFSAVGRGAAIAYLKSLTQPQIV